MKSSWWWKRGNIPSQTFPLSLYSQLTAADVTFPHNGSACLFTCALLHELLHHFGSGDGAGVGEKVRGKKRRKTLLGIKSRKRERAETQGWKMMEEKDEVFTPPPQIKGHFPLTTGRGVIWNKYALLGNCTAAMHRPLHFGAVWHCGI